MKLKLDEAGHVVVADGKPVYVHDDGREAPFDAAGTVATISRLNGEAKGHRERAEAAEGRLRSFDGIEDADAARRALETVNHLGAGELKTAQQVEEITAKAKKAAEESVASAGKAHAAELKKTQTERDRYRTQLHEEKIGGAFSRSKFIADKIAVPTDLIRSQFGGRFKVDDDGNLVASGADGQPIPSRTNFGKNADFEEAIEALIGEYPYRDAILKGANHSGSGARSPGVGAGGAKTLSRAAFEALPALTKSARMAEGYTVVD